MSRLQLPVWLCVCGAWLAQGPAALLMSAEKVRKEAKVVVVEPDLFRKVMRAEPKPSAQRPFEGLGQGVRGYFARDGKTVVIERTIRKLPRGQELRIALYSQQPYHWQAADPKLLTDVTKEMKKPEEKAKPPLAVGKAGLDKAYSYTGRGEQATLEFVYGTVRDKKPIWVFKIVIKG